MNLFKKSKKNKKSDFIPRFMALVFIAIAAMQTISTIMAFNAPEMASAAEMKLTFAVPIDPDNATVNFTNSTAPIATYIKQIYTYAVGVVGILAAIMLMIGGLRWIVAGGNSSSITEAKEIIFAAFSGMVLVFLSYMILQQVNPALVELSRNVTDIQNIKAAPEQKCIFSPTNSSKNDNCRPLEDANAFCACEYSSSLWKSNNNGCQGSDITKGVCCCGIIAPTITTNQSCQWTKLEVNQYCKDAIGEDWQNENTDKCSGETKPTGEDALKYNCCCNNKINSSDLCPNCLNLKGKISCVATGCSLDKPLAEKILEARSKYPQLKLTQGWPQGANSPSKSACHKNGTCADVSSATTNNEDLINAFKALSGAGLTAHFECGSSQCCNDYPQGINCRYIGWVSGLHFHIDPL